jgi:hypothetical protein
VVKWVGDTVLKVKHDSLPGGWATDQPWSYWPKEISLAPQFKVGDKVKIVGPSWKGDTSRTGKTAVVVRDFKDGDYVVSGFHPLVYPATSLEPVPADTDHPYIIVVDHEPGHLAKAVSEHKKAGYRPLGGVSADNGNFYQAMVWEGQ